LEPSEATVLLELVRAYVGATRRVPTEKKPLHPTMGTSPTPAIVAVRITEPKQMVDINNDVH
jgi:hypothetical protein